MQNFKNFIRHGKAAANKSTANQGTTNVNAQPRKQDFQYSVQQPEPQARHHAISDPNVYKAKPLQQNAPEGDYSAAAVNNQNVAARAGHAAAAAVDAQQKKDQADPEVLERIIAEEREAKGKLPSYPGLERYTLIEKMGDGAFSNVYRAKDTKGIYNEVAVKVVRKFEMNAAQVSFEQSLLFTLFMFPISTL